MKALLNILALSAFVVLIPGSVSAFDSTSPEPSELSYRVFEGQVEGLELMTFHLQFIGDEVVGSVIDKKVGHTAPIKGKYKSVSGDLELTQLTTLSWDPDQEHFQFVGKTVSQGKNRSLSWSGECRSLRDGTDFVGGFEFHEVYPDGVRRLELFHFEKIATQVRNSVKDERRVGGFLFQIEDPGEVGFVLNSEIRKEWYRRLTDKEPSHEFSLTELEAGIPYIFPDMSEIGDPIKDDGITRLVNATVVFNSHDFISIQWYKFDLYGAESWPISYTFRTYDLSTGKQVTLDELLKPGYEARLGELITEAYQTARYLPNQRKAAYRSSGTAAFEKDRSNFFVTADGSIGFGYNYRDRDNREFAKVPILRKQIEPLLKPNSLLERIKLR